MNLRQNKGVTLADAIIAITIFMIFTGLIITISYNIYLQSNFVKRNSSATNYIVDLFEYAQVLEFKDVTTEKLEEYINQKEGISTLDNSSKGYKMKISVKENKEGYIKQIDATVSYKIGKKEKSVTMSTLINK